MSNRIVPATYRAVIDDVMTNIRDHFLEFGVDDQVLQTLQNKWEQKVVDSNVAEFEPGPAPNAVTVPQTHQPLQPLHPQPPPGPQFNLAVPHQRNYSNSPGPNLASYSGQNIKAESEAGTAYILPSLAAPTPPQGLHRPVMMGDMGPGGISAQQFTAAQLQQVMQHTVTQQQLQAMQAIQRHHQEQAQIQRQQQQAQQHHLAQPQTKPSPGQLQAAAARLPQVDGPSSLPGPSGSRRIPQVDGPSSASDSDSEHDSPSPPPPPSTLPLTSMAGSSAAPRAGDEEIGSDLDDDDSENEEEEAGVVGNGADGAGPGDIVYCTYDKVQRVKNKWKCVLKDGIVSVNGKDYLFSKCSGEFEW
ncbi:hypothetical protein FRB95_007140 [Tulasnella sp. JGI-2019a]|nr:hypothetical protein FRB93_013581 [Tulasnella sp. JGI-2019a]KAG9039713.1 hypothetical protein FRB95_007140 [Tulasnella sp. JGI-2019a]